MNTRVALAVMVGSLVVGVSAADLHKTLQGVWVVDEKARLEASPLWQLSTPAKKKELEKQTMAMPATKFEFKAATWGFAGTGDDAVQGCQARREQSGARDHR